MAPKPFSPFEIACLIGSGVGEAALAIELFAARPVFLEMFAEFGGELPAVTRFFLGSPAAYAVLALPSLFLVPAFALPQAPRKSLLLAAALAGLGGAAAFLLAMYLPIFQLAGNIQAG